MHSEGKSAKTENEVELCGQYDDTLVNTCERIFGTGPDHRAEENWNEGRNSGRGGGGGVKRARRKEGKRCRLIEKIGTER